MADLGDLLLIAGAVVGVGLLIKKGKATTAAPSAAAARATAASPPVAQVATVRDEGAELFDGGGAYQPWGNAYAPNFSFYGQGRRRR